MPTKLRRIYLQAIIDSAFAERISTNIEFLSIKNDDMILDCGCGNGTYIDIVNEKCNCGIIGVDIKVSELLTAKEMTRISGRNVDFVLCDAGHLPFRNEGFNKVLCTEVLEHISDDVRTLNEIRRVITKDGILALSVPNSNYPFLWDPVNKTLKGLNCRPIRSGFWSGIWGGHFRLYEDAGLSAKLRLAGFNIRAKRHLGRICLPFNYQLLYLLTGVYFRLGRYAKSNSFSGYLPKKKYSIQVFSTRLIELISRLNRRFVFQNPSLNIAICAQAN